ncbi:MAG: flagellar hook-basal body complex protein FliE [Methylococcales bacterium]|nr:flagellar hook-basal body complex protein FliE [Methylococcales bacterium]
MATEINVNQLLQQMRGMSAQASGQVTTPADGHSGEFANLLKDSIDAVNDKQQTATGMVKGFQTGTSDASMAEVMVSLQKASVSFQAMVQVRNKLVDAYQEIMNMPM